MNPATNNASIKSDAFCSPGFSAFLAKASGATKVAAGRQTSDFCSLTSSDSPLIEYAGCLDSDPFFSLKQCDQIILSKLEARGVQVYRLHEKVPKRHLFRKLNRNMLYPALVARVTRYQPSTINHQPPILHISSQCYAHLIPHAIRCQQSAISRPPTSDLSPLVSITVHDVAEFEYPEDYSPSQLRRWRKRIGCIKGAGLVFAISEFTKHELISKAKIPEEKIIVNHNGVGSEFRVLSELEILDFCRSSLGTRHEALGTRGNELEAGAQKSRFLVLATGSNIYRKNVPTLLRALSKLAERGVPVTLVKAGDPIPSSQMSHAQSPAPRASCLEIINLGFVRKDELIALYNLCDVLAFPSLYEGFGLPVLEAQRCGLPCVISNATSLPEVGGGGALYHDPNNPEQLADQLQRVYEDQALCADLREKGLKNAGRFSWDKHVDTLLQGYRHVLGIRF